MSDIEADLRDLERSYGNMRVKNVSTIRRAISHIEHLKAMIKTADKTVKPLRSDLSDELQKEKLR